ncbi:hypothetical protein VV01_13985 [Luteipulveratus halotolerans]|uniref:PKD domain-containing protein n=2 Tax=Luteipulveratus halotolerans TaxID=1631356 RepID=A0A0L6CPB2_9MICO|nr:hypothetical protein VV01_13985 [Luteipulveratus halotolerans]
MLAVLLGTVTSAGRAVADTTPDDGVAATVSSDALPTWQINGVVWQQVTIGTTVYAVGEFSKVRPPGIAPGGAGERDAGNIFAYDIRTGNPVTGFDHSLNGQALSITTSPDKSRIYVGGDFTAVDGQPRGHIAAFDVSTGALDASFKPSVSGRVRALAATASTVYAGGEFNGAAGQIRKRLAAVNSSTGALLPWAPQTDGYYVWSMTLTPDASKLVVGGQFQRLNDQVVNGMGALDLSTGQNLPWAANSVIKDYNNGGIVSLRADGQQVYGTGFAFGSGGTFEGTFALDPSNGGINWLNDCQGDTYDAYPMGEVVYTVSHVHSCDMIGAVPEGNPRSLNQRHALAFSTQANTVNDGPDQYGWNYKGRPGSKALQWFPDFAWGSYTSSKQAGWTVTGNGDYIAVGGEFPAVNGRNQQGLVRFAVKDKAPNQRGPQTGRGPNPAASATGNGTVRLTWGAASDEDNENLTYEIHRSGTTGPVGQVSGRSTFWNTPTMTFTDAGAPSGQSVTYTVKAKDSFGNTLTLPTTSPVTSTGTPPSAYARRVLSDGADLYWRLGDSGSTIRDWAGSNNGTTRGNVSRAVTGAVSGDSDRALELDPSGFLTSAGAVSSGSSVAAPQTISVEAWVKTSSTKGGKILGIGSSKTGTSSTHDRNLYLDSSGHLVFGVSDGSVKTVQSPATYNDGTWHHVVGTATGGSLKLYVDGSEKAARSDVGTPRAVSGYWRSGDSLSGWPGDPSADSVDGVIDDAAVYPTVLSAASIASHHQLGSTGAIANVPPTAAFTATGGQLSATFDASASSDADGSVASYAWDFGDGSSGTGAKPSHTYAAAGTYTVRLTVTDDKGATGTLTKQVTVTAPPANQPPAAAFSSDATQLTVALDGSASTDADGSVASYAWDFGDGSSGTGAKPSHTYAAAGTYTVRLTVTDDKGATDSVSHDVTVQAPAAAIVVDDFNRDVTGGLGSADTGGAWTLSGSAARFSVDGDKGQLEMAAAGSGVKASLGSVSVTDTDLTVDTELNKAPAGASVYTYATVRRVGTTAYVAKLRWRETGAVELYLTKVVDGVETTLAGGGSIPGVTVDDTLTLRLQAVGTTVRAKVWTAGSTEPSTWRNSVTDTTAALQRPGGIGLEVYLAGTVTNAPIKALFDNLLVKPAQE